MGLYLSTPAAEEPVTVAEAKLHAKIDIADDDALVTSLLLAARDYCQLYTRRQFVTAGYTLTLDAFRRSQCDDQNRPGTDPRWSETWNAGGTAGRSGQINLPLPPVQSVTSISYVDLNGATQTLDAANYQLDIRTEPARLRPAYGLFWPAARQQFAAVTIVFVAGYGAASAVPAGLKTAIKLLVAHWYSQREAASAGILSPAPYGVDRILNSFRYHEYV